LRMAQLLSGTLQEEGHQVVLAQDGRAGLEIARASVFDVIILDWMLPHMDGPSVARRLRKGRNQTPILMLTARDSVADTVAGLDSGIDDYLTKPFAIDVLLARVRAVSRRGPVAKPVYLEIGGLRLDPAGRSVTRDGKPILLTPREYKLLELFMRNPGRAMSRDAILESVWGFETDVTENTIEVFVRALRAKVDTKEPKLIHTVRGFGYLIKEPG
jgi:two-component system OmpR family response regulator